jgi:hypothetical protein
MNDSVHLHIDGDMAKTLIDIAPGWSGQPAIYVYRKAMYGTLQAALLFWERLSNPFISWVFVVN